MKALVTGGAGFIGSHLVEHLISKNYKVVVLDNLSTGKLKNLQNVKNKINFINIDISKKNNLSSYFKNVDLVFHLAGLSELIPSIKKPEEYYKTNVGGTFNILEASRKSNIKKFVYAASASCYGEAKKLPISENFPIDTRFPYALTKWMGEQLVINWSKIYKLPSVSLRLFNVYGKRLNFNGGYGSVFKIFLSQKLANKALTIVGDGNQTRDFIYISDVIEAMYKTSLSKIAGEVFNVGTGREVSVNKIADLISKKKVFISKRPGEIERSVAGIKKIKKTINWKPKISIKQGINLFINNIEL